MPFNSLNFAIFFLIFYVIYLVLLKSHRLQNLWLSGCQLCLLCLLGLALPVRSDRDHRLQLSDWPWSGQDSAQAAIPHLPARRSCLGLGLLVNLGTLIFFKYSDFFSAGLLRIFDRLRLYPWIPSW